MLYFSVLMSFPLEDFSLEDSQFENKAAPMFGHCLIFDLKQTRPHYFLPSPPFPLALPRPPNKLSSKQDSSRCTKKNTSSLGGLTESLIWTKTLC